MLPDNEKKYERLFNETTTPDGRYYVHLPFKQNPPIDIVDSRKIAIQQYLHTFMASTLTRPAIEGSMP